MVNYDSEFMSEIEFEETTDSFLEYIREQGGFDENISVLNPMKLKAIKYTYSAMKYLTKGTGAKVTYELHKPFNSMGSVSVVGKNLTFSNPNWIMIAARLASNFNVYPKTDGSIRMDFTFHGLTKSIE